MFKMFLNMPLTQKLRKFQFRNVKFFLKKVETFVYFAFIEPNNSNNRKEVHSAA